MRFGLSTHLYHGERLSRRHIEIVKAQGFDALEIFATRTHFDYHDHARIDEVGGWLNDIGVAPVSMHAPICEGFTAGVWGRAYSIASSQSIDRQQAVEETRLAFDAAGRLGVKTMVLHLGIPRGQEIPPGDNNAGAMRRSVETISEAAVKSHVRLAVEVMPNDLSTPAALLGLLDDLELGDAGICLDFGHAHLLGGAPEAADALSGEIITTHVHDNKGQLDNHLVPFEGTIDWPATITTMWKMGYDGNFVFEVADHGDAASVLQRTVGARTRLQAILKGLAEPIRFDES
jgi:sugar phosphate isomerase/epimerase